MNENSIQLFVLLIVLRWVKETMRKQATGQTQDYQPTGYDSESCKSEKPRIGTSEKNRPIEDRQNQPSHRKRIGESRLDLRRSHQRQQLAYFVPTGYDASGLQHQDPEPPCIDINCEHITRSFESLGDPDFFFWHRGGNGVSVRMEVEHKIYVEHKDDLVEQRCCYVQFVKGFGKIKKDDGTFIDFGEITKHGVLMKTNYPDWIVDSVDDDPNYENVRKQDDTTWIVRDSPNFPKGVHNRKQFKTCLYECPDVPDSAKSANVPELIKKAIKCVDWDIEGWRKNDDRLHKFPGIVPVGNLPDRY